MLNMLILLAFVSCVLGQSLPDPPKVTVDPAILQKFGITEDVNQPGLFQHLVSITPGINYTHIAKIHNIYQNRLDMSPIHFSKVIIDIYRPLPEASQAQFVAAHILNVYQRLYRILNKINEDIVEAFKQFIAIQPEDSERQRSLCASSPSIAVAASHFTRQIKISDACREFVAMVGKDRALAFNLMLEAYKDNAILQQVNRELEKEDVSFSEIMRTVRINPIIPSLYQNEANRQLTVEFEDYSKFLNSIPHPLPVSRLIPAFPPKHVWANAFTGFLTDLQLGPGNVL